MAKRDVQIVIRGRDEASKEFAKVERSVKRLGTTLNFSLSRGVTHWGGRMMRTFGGISRQIGGMTRSLLGSTAMIRQMGTMAAMYFGARAVGNLVRFGIEYERTMSIVGALANATWAEMDQLNRKAKELGATTVFTAKEVADGMKYLARAGFEVNEILGAMAPLLTLTASGELEMGQAAGIVAKIMRSFGHGAKELQHDVDVLVAGFTGAVTDLEEVGNAMSYIGPIARGLEMDIESVVAAVMMLSDANMAGQKAGTGLRRVLATLDEGTESAGKRLEELGIKTFDAAGKLRPLADLIDEFNAKVAHLGSGRKMTKMFELFKLRAGPAWSALSLAGGDALRQKEQMLRDSISTAAMIAERNLDNVKGRAILLKSVVMGVWLDIKESQDGVLMDMLEGMRNWVTENHKQIVSWAENTIEWAWKAKDGMFAFIEFMQDDWLGTLGWVMDSFIDLLYATFKTAVTMAIAGGRGIWQGVREGLLGGGPGEAATNARIKKLYDAERAASPDKFMDRLGGGMHKTATYGRLRRQAEAELIAEQTSSIIGESMKTIAGHWEKAFADIFDNVPSGLMEKYEAEREERLNRLREMAEDRFGRRMMYGGDDKKGGAPSDRSVGEAIQQLVGSAKRPTLAFEESRFLTMRRGGATDYVRQTAKNTQEMIKLQKQAIKKQDELNNKIVENITSSPFGMTNFLH